GKVDIGRDDEAIDGRVVVADHEVGGSSVGLRINDRDRYSADGHGERAQVDGIAPNWEARAVAEVRGLDQKTHDDRITRTDVRHAPADNIELDRPGRRNAHQLRLSRRAPGRQDEEGQKPRPLEHVNLLRCDPTYINELGRRIPLPSLPASWLLPVEKGRVRP